MRKLIISAYRFHSSFFLIEILLLKVNRITKWRALETTYCIFCFDQQCFKKSIHAYKTKQNSNLKNQSNYNAVVLRKFELGNYLNYSLYEEDLIF